MITLYAQPYDISAHGFFFETAEDYKLKAARNINDFGFPVEEYEIQFTNGKDIDAKLFEALKIHQGNFPLFLESCDNWEDDQKQKVIIAIGECGYSFDLNSVDPDNLDVEIHKMDSLRQLAMQFVDEGLFGDIPERLQYFLDYDAIAQELSMDYSEIVIAGEHLIYRCY